MCIHWAEVPTLYRTRCHDNATNWSHLWSTQLTPLLWCSAQLLHEPSINYYTFELSFQPLTRSPYSIHCPERSVTSPCNALLWGFKFTTGLYLIADLHYNLCKKLRQLGLRIIYVEPSSNREHKLNQKMGKEISYCENGTTKPVPKAHQFTRLPTAAVEMAAAETDQKQ